MSKEHHYTINNVWTGNRGNGTENYQSYDRNYTLSANGKIPWDGSADPAFRGDASKYNPEEFLLMALSSCHMLWFLHLCADNGIIVTAYTDNARGLMTENAGGGGQFKEVTLYPQVIITDASKIDLANSLHKEAGAKCFIANSCNFPVNHLPTCEVAHKQL